MPDANSLHQVQLLGITMETWAIVLATFTGPIAALAVNFWRDQHHETRTRRLAIFRTLMATRKTAINPQHVEAINLVEVEFYGVSSIISSWNNYQNHLNSASGKNAEDLRTFEDTRADLLAKLIFSISGNLGFKMSELDIRKGGYAPDGWRYRDDRLGTIQEYIRDIALGKASIPVRAVQVSEQSSPDDRPKA